MKRRLKGRLRYFPGCLYAVVFGLFVMLLEIYFLARSDIEISKSSPSAILIFFSYILPYIIFMFVGKKLFDLTEKIFLKTSEPYKANQRAVLTESLVFFGSFALELFIVTKII
jgi:hypothetical protein